MKNYMATEDGGWDTSTLFIRRSLRAAIDLGRRSGLDEGPETFEAYRLMGQALHTLEDLLAHSNWCEVALRRLGYNDVFCHVGDNGLCILCRLQCKLMNWFASLGQHTEWARSSPCHGHIHLTRPGPLAHGGSFRQTQSDERDGPFEADVTGSSCQQWLYR